MGCHLGDVNILGNITREVGGAEFVTIEVYIGNIYKGFPRRR
jgi:hypothetical protein